MLQAYGDKGVERIIKILEGEVVRCMRLLGASTIADLVPEMVSRLAIPFEVMLVAQRLAKVEQVNWQPLSAKL